MNVTKKCKRYWRGLRYVSHWTFMERLWGLDFSMRDKSLIAAASGVMYGYCVTPHSHFRAILRELDFNHNRAFLDIGCGKGLALKLAREHPGFSKCGGVEYDKRLAGICVQTMHRLGFDDVTVWVGDAREL